jgi:hypothetical protein
MNPMSGVSSETGLSSAGGYVPLLAVHRALAAGFRIIFTMSNSDAALESGTVAYRN